MAVTGDLAHDSSLWRYCVELYGQPGVQQWLLGLQDRAAVDVNLVLLACWCSRHEVRLSTAEWRHLSATTAVLRQHVIAPLRRQRRRLDGAALPAVRRHLLQAELAAENALHAQLWQWWCAEHPAAAPAPSCRVALCCEANLARLADFYGMGRLVGTEPIVTAVQRLMAPQSPGDSDGRDELPF